MPLNVADLGSWHTDVRCVLGVMGAWAMKTREVSNMGAHNSSADAGEAAVRTEGRGEG